MDKKKLINKIISKTKLFIFILIFVSAFKVLFGDENVSVGIITVIALLVLLGHDLTDKPLKNFSLILTINLGIGFASFIAANNIWIGMILDFLTLALIGYYLGYNLTKGLILPFGLGYLFMLYQPVHGDLFIKRILALAVGSIVIMITQFMTYSKKKKKVKTPEEKPLITYDNKDDELYKNINIFGKNFKVHTIRASYAIRIGILTALTSTITTYFNLSEGRWLAYTVFSLTEFYAEHCVIRSKKRIEGTIIGTIIVIFIFMFIKETTLRQLIVLIAGYLNSFFEDYRNAIVLVTISAITPLAIANGSVHAAFTRIFYVILGIILSLLANKFILNRRKKDFNIN